jgi:uncharacterized protein (DUF885 family)
MSDIWLIDRRSMLAGLGATAAFATTPLRAQSAGRDAQLDALLMKQFNESLRNEPTGATSLALDVGPNADLRSKFPDWSAAGIARQKARNAADLAALRAFGRAGLSDDSQVAYDSALFSTEAQVALDRFAYHTGGFAHRPGPYGVTQLGGFYTGVSNFLDLQHPVKTKEDADAYLARLEAVPGLFDADTAIVRANADMGVVAPTFILEQALQQLTRLRDGDSASKTMVKSIAERSAKLGLQGYGDRAARIFAGPIKESVQRQIAILTELLPRSTQESAATRLPNGKDYYAATLRLHTTTGMSGEEIHKLGLEQVADLNGRIDALLKANGYREGSISQRLEALSKAPGQMFANNDSGRAELLAYLNNRLDAIRPKLPAAFARLPTLPYEIRRVPPEIEIGAPGGSAQRGTPDGSRPGIFFINLRDTAEWPRFKLPTLAFHEGAPGHLFEGALSLENKDLPIYRQVASSTAYGEGWGLYSEQVADELGMYADDPLGKIGYLSSFAFRASRLVVDTGLHVFGWSREKATAYMVANSSESPSSARTEIDRYIVYPGQATAYKVGQITISRLRAEAERSPRFDLKAFHSLVLDSGRIPLAVLERRVKARFG